MVCVTMKIYVTTSSSYGRKQPMEGDKCQDNILLYTCRLIHISCAALRNLLINESNMLSSSGGRLLCLRQPSGQGDAVNISKSLIS